MNRGLLWGLGVTTAISAWALLNPAPATMISSSVVPAAPGHSLANGVVAPQSVASAPSGDDSTGLQPAALPAHWPQPEVEPAPRNPFLVAPPAATKPIAVAAPPPPPPPPPISNYRFWGRLTVAGGQRVTYLSRGESGNPVAIDVGTRLEDGWMVDAIGDNAIVLVHAATQQRSTVSIPPHGTSSQP